MTCTSDRIYLDYAASTPVDTRVLEAMIPYMGNIFGNPSSVHTFGQLAETAVEGAREMVARILNCQSDEIIFTSCGSESDNLAIRGTAWAAYKDRGANHILISPVEHYAVSYTAQQLADIHGFDLEFLPVDKYGLVEPKEVIARIRSETALVSVIYANNEIGTINPISEIGKICRERGIPFHTDAVQAAAYLNVDVDELHVDLMAIGAHKFYGPKGVGALYVRKGAHLHPIQTGGNQEFGLRAGTHNVPYIVGLAESLNITQMNRHENNARVQPLRDRIIGNVLEEIREVELTGHPHHRLPNHASFVIKDLDGNALLMLLDVEGFACSSGSACKTGDPEPSKVLDALGYSPDWGLGSLRISLGRHTTPEEITRFLDVLPVAITRTRAL
jgi:cysteine desulfurase